MASERRRLIVVSNRGPVTHGLGPDGRRTVRRGGGGLVTALRPLVSHHDVTWIASAISDEDRAVVRETGGRLAERAADGSAYTVRLVAHDSDAYDRFYNVIANPLLWFVQHYLWDLASAPVVDDAVHEAWESGYVAVNEAFADAVARELDGDGSAVVLFHDYHLYLAPRLVRERLPDATLAHFVHIPWPDAGYWRVLPGPWRSAIHDGLLANDLVGFHTRRWRSSFVAACSALLGCKTDGETVEHAGRRTACAVRPISVDPAEFDALAAAPGVLARQRQLREWRPERLVVRVDRTDPSKNVVRGFRAFELVLEREPSWRGRAAMLALLDPSRQNIPEYAAYLEAIESAAAAVNDRFGTETWSPIRLQIEDDFLGSVAAYKEYDVLLVNAVYDGLNLVAKEGPLVNERDGALVLSENTGAYDEIGSWAVPINPFDVAEQASAILEALALPQRERRARLEATREHVRANDIGSWVDGLLADLDRALAARR